MPAPLYFTADMVRALPEDGNRYEVVHGELLVTPAPRPLHQRVQVRLLTRIATYLLEWDPLESTCRHASLSIL